MNQFLFDHRQQIPAVNRRAYFRVYSHDSSALWRLHFVLHLHSFNHSDAGAGFDSLTYFDKHAHKLSRHRRHDPRGCVSIGTERHRAAQTLWISKGNRMSIRTDNHVETGARLGTAFNPAIKDMSITNQQIMIII